ncbi:MAG TPA: patatin-like phospholipase family protein [Xanthomonadales bacterium]|nr:patatin-like phospholipase family protein [Xanthomonadales bacterium]
MYQVTEWFKNRPAKFRPSSGFYALLQKWCGLCLTLTLMGGCASYGVIKNTPSTSGRVGPPYGLKTWADFKKTSDLTFILSFSGGGTRAAAMAYGVLQELRDTNVAIAGQQKRLLDEVDHISSVSGGSFTAAYYGLNGDGIFDTFEEAFLRRDVEKHMTRSLLRPIHWFSRKDRTQRAIEYYQDILFHDATFADMIRPDRPMIVINASDLAHGFRFSFIQGYFDLLCSDLNSFPVANAVAASSAVPVLFNPVVIENYAGCEGIQWPPHVEELAQQNAEFALLYEGAKSYQDKENRKYIHYVDGGITDNMGLRAMTDVMAVSGGPSALLSKLDRKPPRHMVFISVNASTSRASDMDKTTKQPGMLAAMNAMTDVQLHRYNAATVQMVESQLKSWAAKASTPEHPITPYFIEIGFEEVPQPQLKLFLNKIPTSFSLSDEQVDALIESARSLLRSDPVFQQFLADLARQ